jgi:5-methylcytosine-specific restriction endonuclease McrA
MSGKAMGWALEQSTELPVDKLVLIAIGNFADEHHQCFPSRKTLECDHVTPVSRGGDHSDENLVTACRPCNRAKRDKIVTVAEWMRVRRAGQ